MKAFTTLATASAVFLSVVNASAIEKRTPAIQPSCTDFTPFTYSGCYSDAGDPNPALIYRATSLDSQNTTIQQCVAFCKGNNWRYAGLEYYGICFCGNSVTGQLLDDNQCNTPCKANETQACGGNSKISIYQDPTFVPIEDTSIADYDSVGCYSEGPNGRTLYWRNDDVDESSLDVNECLTACRNEGFPFAGVEFGRECYCGNVLANGTQILDSSRCDFPCSGDPTQTCGGAGALNLYVAKDLDTREPCKDGLPVPTITPTLPPVISTTTTTSASSTVSTTTSPASTTTTSAPSSTTTTTSPASTSTTTRATTVSSSTTTTRATTTVITTTTTQALCTSYTTSTPAPVCEYKVGNWCSTPLPPFTDKDKCKVAAANCMVQFFSCFLTAGYPESLKCLNFKQWCLNVNSYCGNSCPGTGCSNSKCKSKYPPISPPNTQPTPVVSSSVGPCATSSTTTARTTTTTTTSTVVPVPTSDCMCEQPHRPSKGYTRDDALGDIELPCLTCNNDYSDYKSGNYFKVYNNANSKKCPSYTKDAVPRACQKACDNQYTGCINTYAESCKSNSRKLVRSTVNSRGYYGKKYDDAMDACKQQWKDCYDVNSSKNAGNRCSSYNNGWSKY